MGKKLFLLLSLLLTLSAHFTAAQSEPITPPMPKLIKGLEWLIGGVWTSDASAMGNGMERIETRYVWSDNSAFIRFTTHFVFSRGC